jgi:AraC family transcriptional regulator
MTMTCNHTHKEFHHKEKHSGESDVRFQTTGFHQRKVSRALLYIQDHLGEPLRLDDVAGVAYAAPSHFHVMFRNVMGQPLQAYVRQLRLHWAAYRLLFSDQQIIRVALDAGYDSHEAFTRSFRRMFGVTPSHYRKRLGPLPGKEEIDDMESSDPAAANDDVVRCPLPAGKLVYAGYFGPYGERHQAWERIVAWVHQAGIDPQSLRPIGIIHDIPDPSGTYDIRYDAGVLLSDPSVVPGDGLGVQWLDPLDCLSTRHHGPWMLTHNTFVRLANAWVSQGSDQDGAAPPRSGLLPYYEVFQRLPIRDEDAGPCDIRVPLRGHQRPGPGPFAVFGLPANRDVAS